jgi:hypothetical protein
MRPALLLALWISFGCGLFRLAAMALRRFSY